MLRRFEPATNRCRRRYPRHDGLGHFAGSHVDHLAEGAKARLTASIWLGRRTHLPSLPSTAALAWPAPARAPLVRLWGDLWLWSRCGWGSGAAVLSVCQADS
jgi:hypothetical protein